MEKANVINGDGEITNYIINTLLDNAIEFYGKKYEDIIIRTIRDVKIYELGENESMDAVITKLTLQYSKEGNHKNNLGTFLYPRNSINNILFNYGEIIIYKISNDINMYHTFVHELFGHAVCSRKNKIIQKNDKLYNRNGLALHGIDNNEVINRYLNEGAMDFIAESIVNMHIKISNRYDVAKMSCKRICDYIGKDKFIDTLVFGKNDLEMDIDNMIEKGYFNNLSILNDRRFNYENRDKHTRSYAYKKKIIKELDKMRVE